MSLPFDATLKDLGRDYPTDLLTTFDQPPTGRVGLLNVDLSTVTRSTDLVMGIGEPLEEAVHVDFQVSAAAWKHADILTYNALLHAIYHVPVHSLVLLLRPQAAHSNLNGVVTYSTRSGRGSINFVYEIVRVWERPAELFLKGALGTLPFAVLGTLTEGLPTVDSLIAVTQRLIERIDREASSDQGRKLLTSAFLLAGLRVKRSVALHVFRGVRQMRESDTYLAILDEGRDEGREEQAKAVILRLAKKRFGPIEESKLAQLKDITDLERLNRLIDNLFDARSWQDLLDTP